MNDQGVTWAEVALAVLPALTTLAAGVVGWLFGRGRERRDMRRQAYVNWLKAARYLVVPPDDDPQPGRIQVPFPKRKRDLNDATIEIQIVGSGRVTVEAKKFLDSFRLLDETAPEK